MKKWIKAAAKGMVPAKVKQWVIQDWAEDGEVTYAQEGEDKLIARLLNNKPNGFFVDVGAHHPRHFSNTYYFYKQGWRGINIDAMPGSMRLFNELRKEDHNVEAAISDIEMEMDFYAFSVPELNTLSREAGEERKNWEGVQLLRVEKVWTKRLDTILDDYFKKQPVKSIDFLSVDVEGLDLQVLRSNNWEKYRPALVLAEELDTDFGKNANGAVSTFLHEQGYQLVARTCNTVFYRAI